LHHLGTLTYSNQACQYFSFSSTDRNEIRNAMKLNKHTFLHDLTLRHLISLFFSLSFSVYTYIYLFVVSPNWVRHEIYRWLRYRRFTPALKPNSSLYSLSTLPYSLAALLYSLVVPPYSPSAPSCCLATCSRYCALASINDCWILIRKEPVMAPPTSHHVISCSFPLTLSLHFDLSAVTNRCTKHATTYVFILYLLYILLFLSLFALYI